MWFENVVKTQLKGFAQLVRYADDFVVCFQYGDEAKVFEAALRKRLDKFGLKISEEKKPNHRVWARCLSESKEIGQKV